MTSLFNPDGSIKIPERIQKIKEENKARLKRGRCIRIRKEVVSQSAPKKCKLYLTLSDGIADNRFVEYMFRQWNENASTPGKLIKISKKEFEIEIGTDFRRCSNCTGLIGRYRGFLDGNIILEKGNCTYDPQRNFCYDDYFD